MAFPEMNTQNPRCGCPRAFAFHAESVDSSQNPTTLAMQALASNASTREGRGHSQKFKVILRYLSSLQLALATFENPPPQSQRKPTKESETRGLNIIYYV